MVSYHTSKHIPSAYKAYYGLSCVIVVQASISVLHSFNHNVLHDIWNENVLVRYFFPGQAARVSTIYMKIIHKAVINKQKCFLVFDFLF